MQAEEPSLDAARKLQCLNPSPRRKRGEGRERGPSPWLRFGALPTEKMSEEVPTRMLMLTAVRCFGFE